MKKLSKVVVIWTLVLTLALMVNTSVVFADDGSWDYFSDGSTEGIVLPVSGTDGDLNWSISADGLLTISGTGDLEDIGYGCERAWYDYRGVITKAEVNVSDITDMSYLFYGCTKLTSVDFTGSDTSNVTTMECMFYVCYSLSSLDLSMLDTSSVTTMYLMFNSCGNLTSLNLAGIDTSSVVDMEAMFQNCVSLPSLDLSGFDTSNVNTMRNMFYGCYALEDLNLSSFDTSNVTTMLNMFHDCSSLTSLDLSSFNTSNVTTMYNMFYGCSSLTSLNLSSFDMSNVTDVEYMFYGCTSMTTLIMPANCLTSTDLPDVSGYEWKNESGTVCTSITAGLSSKMTYTRYTKEKDSQTITISAEDSSIKVGEITYVDAYSTGDGEITFASSDTSIATVDSASGLVTGKGVGTVTITATAAATDTYKKATASCTITIGLAKPTISSVTQSNKTVTVKWSKVSGASGYYVYRSTSSGNGYSKVATITSGSTVSWKDTASKSNGKTYYYKVYAYSGNVKSSASSYKSIKYMKGTVSSLTNKSTGITVKWSKVSSASGYYIYRKASSASSYTKVKTITSASTVSYTDTAVKSKNGTTYTYYVQPYNSTSKGAYATKKTVRLTGTTISSLKNSSSKKMTVKWGKNNKATGYQIQYSTSSSFSSYKTVTVKSYKTVSKTISSLTKGKTYYVRVRSYKTVSGTKYYSAWSSKKKVKISK